MVHTNPTYAQLLELLQQMLPAQLEMPIEVKVRFSEDNYFVEDCELTLPTDSDVFFFQGMIVEVP